MVLKKYVYLVIGIVLILVGCSKNSDVKPPETVLKQENNIQEKNENIKHEPKQEYETEQKNKGEFLYGTWLSYDGERYRYYVFNDDGVSGAFVFQETGTGLNFEYEINDNSIVFHMGDVEDNSQAVIEINDDEHFTLKWDEYAKENFTYLSDEMESSFQYYSDNELCYMAILYANKHAKENEDLSNLNAALIVNEDQSVTIQLYEELDGHNSTYAWYTVDRKSAVGKNDTTGDEIDLKY